MIEEWCAVPGFEGSYEVSDQGRVRSLPRLTQSNYKGAPYRKKVPGGLLKPQKHTGGYLHVGLSGKIYLVNWLVLEAFESLRPDGYVSCHNDGDKTNNRKSNLRWDTPKENKETK